MLFDRSEAEKYSYTVRLNDVIHCSKYVEKGDGKMIFSFDGLLSTTRNIVSRFSENKPRLDLTFKDLRHFARAEREAARARVKQ